MSKDNLSTFGELIATKLRDPAIERFENLSKGDSKAPALQDLQARLRALDPETREVVRRCVVSAVDSGIHDFLFILQEGEFKSQPIEVLIDSENMAGSSDGLHGEIFGDDGWFARFSAYGKSPDVA